LARECGIDVLEVDGRAEVPEVIELEVHVLCPGRLVVEVGRAVEGAMGAGKEGVHSVVAEDMLKEATNIGLPSVEGSGVSITNPFAALDLASDDGPCTIQTCLRPSKAARELLALTLECQ
jgi:hypothetical protein